MKNLASTSFLNSRRPVDQAALLEYEAAEERRKSSELLSRMSLAGIPKRFLTAGLSDICKDYTDRLKENIESGTGLFIFGAIGTGKTYSASAIAAEAIRDGYSVRFATTLDVFAEIKASYNAGKTTEDDVVSKYANCHLLVLDDLGKEAPTDWALSMLFRIINARYEQVRPLIVTTQYSEAALIARLSKNGDTETAKAILSRIAGTCTKLTILGKDRRLWHTQEQTS